MNEVPEPIARWLEQQRRSEQATAAVLAVFALGGGAAVFLVMGFLIQAVLSIVSVAFFHFVPWLGLVALGLTVGFFARSMKGRQEAPGLGLDPMGYWIARDIAAFGPRLILEGLRQVRRCGQLGELNVAVCARVLAYLAVQNAAVTWDDLLRHCPPPSPRLREYLSLLDGVLFLGEDASRVILMEPFRLRLRAMLGRETRAGKEPEPARPGPEVPPPRVPVNEPEKLSAYEILGLRPSASVAEIKKAYRKRVKECHPDLFAGMDLQARASAERWTRALNAAYATLNPRHPAGAGPSAYRQR
jgi:hypothetical protein